MNLARLAYDVGHLLLFILPAMAANGAPVVMHGPPPIDFGRRMPDGRRIFGDGKTWGGLLGGITAGVLVGAAEIPVLGGLMIFYALVESLGAMTGDLVGSFVKRRIGLERGAPAPVLDQLGFYAFALLFLYWVGVSFNPVAELLVAAIIYGLHRATNFAAYKAGLKSVPW